ncbi:hypothetical protein BJY52DRAFT_1127653, partial [Lactarius psammicola]
DELDLESDDDNALIDIWENRGNEERRSCKEGLETHIRLLQDFCDGLKFQVKFQDPQFLKILKKDGAGFFRLAQNCLSYERCLNSSHAASLLTWERSTANTMFYRSHPCHDRDT